MSLLRIRRRSRISKSSRNLSVEDTQFTSVGGIKSTSEVNVAKVSSHDIKTDNNENGISQLSDDDVTTKTINNELKNNIHENSDDEEDSDDEYDEDNDDYKGSYYFKRSFYFIIYDVENDKKNRKV